MLKSTLNISNLLFDEKVENMVEENGCLFPTKLLNNIIESNTFKLNQDKLQNVLNKNNIKPIYVIKGLGEKYIVMNGRHRVCASIMNKCDTIECFIVENINKIIK